MMRRKWDRAALLALCATVAATPGVAQAGLFSAKPASKAPATTAAKPASPPPKADAATRAAADRQEPLARAAFWAHEVDADPADVEAALHLAAALRSLGRFEEAQRSADKALVIAPHDEEGMLEGARALIGADRAFYALDYLNRAQAVAPKDWRVWSLFGVAYGQTKRLAEARAAYAEALRLSPENPAVLSNLAITLAAAGDAAEAEPLLRRAAARPGAGVAERQNLALVLGLQGKLGEAESLIRRDLPPEVADSNLAYLQAANAKR